MHGFNDWFSLLIFLPHLFLYCAYYRLQGSPILETSVVFRSWSQSSAVSQPTGDQSHESGGRHTVTSPAAEHHHPLADTKLYCLVTEACVCKQLAQGCTWQCSSWDSNIVTCWLQVRSPNRSATKPHYGLYPNHLFQVPHLTRSFGATFYRLDALPDANQQETPSVSPFLHPIWIQ